MFKRVSIPMTDQRWQFWIDRGGTFTDIIARKPKGELLTYKLLSENPNQYKDAALQGMRHLLEVKQGQVLPAYKISAVKMGTTVATNELLERQGENTLLLITKGFKDALRIGYQTRPDLFALDIELPDMLYQQVIEVEQRINAAGKRLTPLNTLHVTLDLRSAFKRGFRSLAIVLMHGYRYHADEKKIKKIALEIGFSQVSVSHEVSPLMKLVSRGDTTVVDAYLSPILKQYTRQIAEALQGMSGQLSFMQSNGGLTDARHFQGKDAILSGPAGGIIGMVRTAEQAGFKQLIGFDMGGTSTDVSHYNAAFERTFETEVAGVRVRAPMMLIHTIAAGGGSILSFDGSRYRVGPESAAASPGPAAYRNGGPLTITDCHVILGRLQPDEFPAIFGQSLNQRLDKKAVSNQFIALAQQIQQATGTQLALEEIATGYLHIAIANMANAIKKISVQRGYDVSNYALCSFGGAGGQHACLVADALGIKTIFLHPFAGVLSAYGMGLADTTATKQQAIEEVLTLALFPLFITVGKTLQRQAEQELVQQGIPAEKCRSKYSLQCRYQGSDTALSVQLNIADIINDSIDRVIIRVIINQFEAIHRQRFGFIAKQTPLVIESMQVEVVSKGEAVHYKVHNNKVETAPKQYQLYVDKQWQRCNFYQRELLTTDQIIQGPAVILEATGTNVIETGWQATLTKQGNLIIERYQTLPQDVAIGTQVDPVTRCSSF